MAAPKPVFASNVPNKERKGELVSPLEAPQPAKMVENSSFEARVKKILEGIVSSFVTIPTRVKN